MNAVPMPSYGYEKSNAATERLARRAAAEASAKRALRGPQAAAPPPTAEPAPSPAAKPAASPPKKAKTSWIQCDDCQKWRIVPQAYTDSLGDDDPWRCSMNPDPAKSAAACEAPEDQEDS